MPSRPDITNPVHFVACGFGAGFAPIAPGTFGTLVAVPLYLLLSDLALPAYIGATVLVALVGVWLCGRTAQDTGVHDHGAIVWDEIAGFLVTMTAAPAGWGWVVVGFALFRLFDIWKPWPIDWFDRQVGGGLGIMLDDLLAGAYAWVALQVLAALRIW